MNPSVPPFSDSQRGAMQAEISALHRENQQRDQEIRELRQDVKEILAIVNQGKGGIWVGMAVAGVLGGIVSFVAGHLGLTIK